MKFAVFLLAICGLSMVKALPQYKIDRSVMPPPTDTIKFVPPPTDTIKFRPPLINTSGGGSFKQGQIDVDVRQPVWQSPNQRHSFDVSGGYGKSWGNPDISSKPDVRYGVGYKYNFG